MSVIGLIISLLITGIVIGALGRLVVPGPNPIGFWPTVGVGVLGAVIGGVIAGLIGAGAVIAVILEIAVAAGIVALISRRGQISRRY